MAKVTFYEPECGTIEDKWPLEAVLDVLSLVLPPGDCPGAAQAKEWTIFERAIAYNWAFRTSLKASDNRVSVGERPSFTRPRKGES